jgi:hypothetical protein
MDDDIPIIRGSPPDRLPFKDIVDVVQKLVTVAAIVTAGIWALYTFILQRTGIWNLELTVTPEIVQYTPKDKLLYVAVTLKNVGKVRVTPGKNGCQLSVRRLSTNAAAGTVLATESPTNRVVRWQEAGEPVITDVDMLRHYDPGTYQLEPGVAYHEMEAVVLPQGSFYLVKVSFWAGENDSDVVTEYRMIGASQKHANSVGATATPR